MHLLVRNAILILLTAYGYQALWSFASANGLFSLMRASASQNRLPETNETYHTTFTHIAWLDSYLKSLLTLFWPMVNGSRPGSSLMCFYFGGQGTVVWILTLLEGLRRPDQGTWRVVTFTTIYGLLLQGLGIGVVGPIFLTFSPLEFKSKRNVWRHYSANIAGIIPAVTVGVILPTVLMSLHYPTVISAEVKTYFIRFWQFFPAICCPILYLWSNVAKRLNKVNNDLPNKKTLQIRHDALRRVYKFGLCCAAIPHIGTITVSLMAYMFPHLFADGVATQFHPANLFVPVSPFSGAQAESVGQGAHWFLQWDMILMFCTYMVWAYFAYIKVKYPRSGVFSFVTMFWMVGQSLVVGPMGAALLAVWERDEYEFDIEVAKK